MAKIKAQIISIDEEKMTMEVLWSIDNQTIGPNSYPIPMGDDGQPLVGNDLTKKLGNMAPMGDIERLLKQQKQVDFGAFQDELNVNRDVSGSLPPTPVLVDPRNSEDREPK